MPSARSLLVAALCGAAAAPAAATTHKNGGYYHDRVAAAAAHSPATAAPITSASGANSPECIYKRTWEPKNNPSVMIFLYHAGCADKPWPIEIDPVTKQCTDSFFVDVAKGCKSVLAVLNPCRGPYPDNHPNLEALKICSKMLSDHGVQMVGYTHTKVTKMDANGVWTPIAFEPMEHITATMDTWGKHMKGISNFKGFFLDDTTNHADTKKNLWGLDHNLAYQQIINRSREVIPDATIVLNPGVFPSLGLVLPSANFPKPAQISVPFENYMRRWRPSENSSDCSASQWSSRNGQFGVGPWCPFVPVWDEIEGFKKAVEEGKTIAAAGVHSATREFAFSQAPVAHAAKLKYFFATDRNLTMDPWKGVPSFWDDYLHMLNDGEESVAASLTNSTNTTGPAGNSSTEQVVKENSASTRFNGASGLATALVAAVAAAFASL